MVFTRFELLGWGDADGVGSAGADGAARGGLELFGEADFNGGEEVVAATEREAGTRDGGIGGGEEAEDFGRWHRDLLCERGELSGDGYGVEAARAVVKKASGVRPEQVPWVCHSWRRRPGSG
jgi:hypothetical protein